MRNHIKMSWDIEKEKNARELYGAIRTVNQMPNGSTKKILVKSLQAAKRSQRYENKLDMNVVDACCGTIYHNGYWNKRRYPGKTYQETLQEFMSRDYYGEKKDSGMFTIKYKIVKQGGVWTVYHKYDCVI